MTFLAPGHLLLLLPVAALACAYVALQRRRRRYAVRFTNLELLDSVAPRRPGWRRHVPAGAVALALSMLVVALARPARDERVAKEAATVMLVVDTSASMAATDVSPDRLTAARVAAADFVGDMPEGFRVGLVAFDATSRLVASPTTDHGAVVDAIEGLQTGAGTATGDGIYAALDALNADIVTDAADDGSAARSTAIVLLSDGATTVGHPLEEATAAAASRGVPVTTIAYGTVDGVVDIDGQSIAVPADEDAMQRVATATGGTFFTAASSSQLADVLDDVQRHVGHRVEQREILRWFLGAALAVLLLAVAASMLWTGRFL